MKNILLGLIIFSTSLLAENARAPLHDLQAKTSAVDDTRENYFLTSTNVKLASKVNPITGEYSEEEVDLIVAGSEPLSLRRFYNHNAPYDPKYASWRYNPECYFVANFEFSLQDIFASIGEFDGSVTLFKRASPNSTHFQFDVPKSFLTFNPNGQTHPSNIKIDYAKKGDPKNKSRFQYVGEISDGSGRKRLFGSSMHSWNHILNWVNEKRKPPEVRQIYPDVWTPYQVYITEEKLPNGNVIAYSFDKWKESKYGYPRPLLLTAITAYSSDKKVLNSLTFDYVREKDEVKGIYVTGNDKRQVYIQHRSIDPILLGSVTRPGQPDIIYGYVGSFLTEIIKPDGRKLVVNYKDGKVDSLSAPWGPKEEMVPIFRYVYQKDFTDVFNGENQKTTYRFDENKKITAIESFHKDKLIRKESFEWDSFGRLFKKSIKDGDGKLLQFTEYTFDKNHNPKTEKVGDEKEFQIITRTYSDDGFNLKLTESDREGKITHFKYQPQSNRLDSELVLEGKKIVKRTFHFYDNLQTCVKTIVDDGISEDSKDLKEITYRKITEITPKKESPCLGLPEEVLEKTLDDKGKEVLLKKIVYKYTPAGKVATEEHFDKDGTLQFKIINSYDKKERLFTTTNPLGHVTTYTYDDNNNLKSIEGPEKDDLKIMGYNKANQLIEVKFPQEGYITSKRYNKAGHLVGETNASGFETCYECDVLGRVHQISYPDGSTTTKEYDALGNVIKEIDTEGFVTTKTYNFRSQPRSIQHPDGTAETFTYNSTGTLKSYQDRNGALHKYTYDIFDHLIKEEILDSNGKTLKTLSATYSPFQKLTETDGEVHTTIYKYDFAGRKTEELKENKKILFFYDGLGRLAKTENEEFNTFYSYNFLDQLTEKRIEDKYANVQFKETYGYDLRGNKTTVTNSKGKTETKYNILGKPIKEIDPLGHTTITSYNYPKKYSETKITPKGIVEITSKDARERDSEIIKKSPSGETIYRAEKFYYGSGDLKEVKYSIYDGPKFIKTIEHRWELGPKGRIEKFIENGERTTQYSYDTHGNLKEIVKPSGKKIHYEYDALGRLKHHYGSDFDYIYDYDGNDLIFKVEDVKNHEITLRKYDCLGNMISETLGNGLHLTSSYDNDGRRKKLHLPDSTVEYTYDGKYLSKVSWKDLDYKYKRDLDGEVRKCEFPKGEITFERDGLSRIKKIISPFYNAYDFDFDGHGNLSKYSYEDKDSKKECTYKYDFLDQLTFADDHSYQFDSLNSPLKKDDQIIKTNDYFELVSVGDLSCPCDLDGNLITDGKMKFTYDSLDRLIKVEGDNSSYDYTYDAFHRRLSRKGYQGWSNITNYYLWDGDNEIGMTDYYKYLVELRILGEGLGAEIGAACFIDLGGYIYIPLHDHRGSVVALVTPYSKCYEHYRYTAFGTETTSNTYSPWRFSSKRTDENGLTYFGRRYYHPTLGRWLTQDPSGFTEGPNRYAYLHNCPMDDFDPYGLWSWRGTWDGTKSYLSSSKHFLWGMCEGSGYHIYNTASSFGVRDLSRRSWEPQSLLGYSRSPNTKLDWLEQSILPFTYEARRIQGDLTNDIMRARGRAFGEQLVTLGGLLSAWNLAKGLPNFSLYQESSQILSREYLFSGKVNIPQVSKGNRNRFQPHPFADGDHTVFRRDPITNKVSHYETYRKQTNTFDPKTWERVKRFDGIGSNPHWNKVLFKDIHAPHVHDKISPGGVRPALPWEIPL